MLVGAFPKRKPDFASFIHLVGWHSRNLCSRWSVQNFQIKQKNIGDLTGDDFDTTTYYDDMFYDDVDTEETQDRQSLRKGTGPFEKCFRIVFVTLLFIPKA